MMLDRFGIDAGQIGFIAFAWTKWHALGAEAFIHDLRAKGDARPGVVFLMAHPTEGMLVSEEDLIVTRSDPLVRVMRSEDAGRDRSYSLSHASRQLLLIQSSLYGLKGRLWPFSRTVYLVTANVIPWGQLNAIGFGAVIKGASLKVIYLDEGIGSYMPQVLSAQAFARERTSSRLSGMKAIVQRLGERYYDLIYEMVNRLLGGEKRFLFVSSNSKPGLEPDSQVVESYRAVLARGHAPEQHRSGYPVALVLTQPWSELGDLSEISQFELIQKLTRKLVEKNYHVIIKSHPREAVGKYNNLTISNTNESCPGIVCATKNVAAEMYFSEMRSTDIVVGFNSTALVTAAVLYNIEARNIAYDDVRDAGASKYMLEHIRLFNEKFSYFVTNI